MNVAGSELARAAWAQVWQVTLLIAVVALLTRLFARNRPHLAHVLWLVVLLKCVTPPVFNSSSGVFCWMQARPAESSTRPGTAAALPVQREPTVEPPGRRLRVRVESGLATAPGMPDWEVVAATPKLGASANGPVTEVEAKPARAGRGKIVTTALLGCWLIGACAVFGIAAVRWIACLSRVRRAGCRADRSYDRLMASLSRRLKLRRPARLVVTGSRVGPAVIGLFRPTVLLPEIVVREKSAKELEPILAHELIHVRRGDAWVGLLQMVAQSVWWFHPLVWWAGRLVSREAERCCDEAVVAELGCPPARYARCLFDVLQRKLILKPVAACPGVRPVEVTSKRMERIMKLGQGSRKRSPWWCWAVMLLAVAVTLPGAALVAGAGDDDNPPKRPDVQTRNLPPLKPVDKPEPLVSRVYRVDDLLAAARSELSEQPAREHLLRDLARSSMGPGSAGPRRRIEWSGKRLVVRETARGHEHFAAALKRMQTYGFSQITIEVRFITCPLETQEALDINWTVAQPEVPEGEKPGTGQSMETYRFRGTSKGGPWPDPESPHRNRARFVVEKNLPVRLAVLDFQRAKAVVETAQNDRRTSLLQAPKVTVFNGQAATISDTSQSPFVVAVKDGQPQLRVVSEGTVIRVRPVLRDEDSLQLDYGLTLSEILGVESFSVSAEPGQPPATVQMSGVKTFSLPTVPGQTPATVTVQMSGVETLPLPTGSGRTPATVQIPEVETARLDGSIELSLDESLLIGGLKKEKDADGNMRSMMVMLTARKVAPKPVIADAQLYTQTYTVVDLVVPRPVESVPSMTRPQPQDAPAVGGKDFESLAELITSTISPASWKSVGGRGSVAPFVANLSLVVSQTQDVHEEIVDLLEQLRRTQDLQIMLNVEIVHVPQKMLERIGIDSDAKEDHVILGPREARVFRAFVADSDAAAVRPVANATLFNGQQANVAIPAGDDTFLLQPVVAPDRRSVRLTLIVKAKETAATEANCNVGDGRTVLLDLTGRLQTTGNAPGQKTFLLVTPRIVIPEEEEERLGILPPRALR